MKFRFEVIDYIFSVDIDEEVPISTIKGAVLNTLFQNEGAMGMVIDALETIPICDLKFTPAQLRFVVNLSAKLRARLNPSKDAQYPDINNEEIQYMFSLFAIDPLSLEQEAYITAHDLMDNQQKDYIDIKFWINPQVPELSQDFENVPQNPQQIPAQVQQNFGIPQPAPEDQYLYPNPVSNYFPEQDGLLLLFFFAFLIILSDNSCFLQLKSLNYFKKNTKFNLLKQN